MKYYKNRHQQIFGYDETDETQLELIDIAIAENWQDITGQWPPPPNLDDAKAMQAAVVSQAFETALLAGYMTTLNIKMDATLEALQKLKTGYDFCVLMGDATMTVVDYDNVVHADLPLADIVKIMKEVGGNYQTLYLKKQTLRGQVLAASTAEQVAAVEW